MDKSIQTNNEFFDEFFKNQARIMDVALDKIYGTLEKPKSDKPVNEKIEDLREDLDPDGNVY